MGVEQLVLSHELGILPLVFIKEADKRQQRAGCELWSVGSSLAFAVLKLVRLLLSGC